MGFRVWGLGFRVWGLGFRIWGLFGVQVLGRDLSVHGFEGAARAQGSGYMWVL